MSKFPVDAPKAKVVKALEILGFCLIREGNHIALSQCHQVDRSQHWVFWRYSYLGGEALKGHYKDTGKLQMRIAKPSRQFAVVGEAFSDRKLMNRAHGGITMDVSTTMVYTHVLNRGGSGVLSPLDER